VGHVRRPLLDPVVFLQPEMHAGVALDYEKGQTIYSQGDLPDSVFYVREGGIKLTVVSNQGKEAIVALLEAGAFFGQGCITAQPLRMTTATAISFSSLFRIPRKEIIQMLQKDRDFSDGFISYLISHIFKVEEDLVDQLFNSTEKRLARALLLLAHYGQEGSPETVIPRINQEELAEMIGTTRSRVSIFMNKFRKSGLIDYDDSGLHVRSSLLSVILHD
jgi:CRP/FNR family cyclic AMP-dependent transcriptional regulator